MIFNSNPFFMQKKTVLLIAISLSVFCLGLQAQWQPDFRLTNDNSGSWTYGHTPSDNNVWCVAANGNDVHAVWYDYRFDVGGTGEILYKKSTDGGVTWGADIRLTNDPSVSVNPSIAVFNSVVHVVWQEMRDGNYEIYYKRSIDGGLTWGADIRLTNSSFDSWNPSIAVSGSVVHVVWQDNRNGNFEIYYKNSTDGGLTWGSDTRLTNDAAVSSTPVVAVSASDVHAAWRDSRDGNDEIYYKRSADGGLTWGVDTRLTNNIDNSRYPSLAVSGSSVHLVWNDIRDGNWEIYYKSSANAGNTWSSDTRLTNDNNRSEHTSLAVCGAFLNVVWMDNRAGKYAIYFKQSADGGATWNPDLQLTTSPANSVYPSVAVSSSGVHVTWVDERDANDEIYYKRNPTAGCNPNGSLCGQKYNDLNGNGAKDPGEPILTDWQIDLSGTSVLSVRTDNEGNYCFNNLTPGTYTVSEVFQANWVQTQPAFPGTYTVTLAAGQTINNLVFGNQYDTCKSGSKTWSPLASGFNGQVKALVVMGGELYAGGEFSLSGATSVHNIAKWNGTTWSALGSGMNGSVSALAVMGSNLYAGGSFTTAGGVSVSNIAKWDGTNWSALGSGITTSLKALAVIGGNLYVGGNVITAGGFVVNRIAKWDGTTWSALGSGTNGLINALAVNGTDLYVGGGFTQAGGTIVNCIAKWDGANWSAVGSGMNLNGVFALAMMGNNLYAGGMFNIAGGLSVNNIAKWDGVNWSAPGTGANGTVLSLAASGTDLYAGGDFSNAGGFTAMKIAKWDGATWSPLGGGMNSNGVFALALMGTNLYAGGMFSLAGGMNVSNIAKWGCGGSTGIEDGNSQPDPQLEQNYPNPFHSTTTIRFVIAGRSSVNISVYNFLGEEIRVLLNEKKDPGTYEVVFEANGIPDGIYYYTIRTGNFTQSKKMVLLR